MDSNGLLSGMIDCLNLKTKQIDGLSSISVLLFNSTKPEMHTQLEGIFSNMLADNNTTEFVQKVASYVVAMLWRSSNTIVKEKRNTVLQHDDDSIVRLKDESRNILESYLFSYYEAADSSKQLSSYLGDENKHNPKGWIRDNWFCLNENYTGGKKKKKKSLSVYENFILSLLICILIGEERFIRKEKLLETAWDISERSVDTNKKYLTQ